MSFIWPATLVLLLLIPILVALYIWQQRRRAQYAARYASLSLVQNTLRRGPGLRRHVPPALFMLALTILIVALARPQAVVNLPRQEGTIILTFDVSGSMAADDIKPTRMEAAKTAARAFVQRQPPSVQIGVVAFSDSGFTLQSPTNDQDAVLAAINRLSPQRGTSIAHGILGALNAIAVASGQSPNAATSATPTPTPVPQGTYTPAVIVLLTDGENNESPDPVSAAQTAQQQGVRIYTVGIGSAAGTLLHINGFTVHTALDEGTLRQISQLTDGAYYNAESAQDLLSIYENLNPQLVLKAEKTELTALLAGGGILVLLVGGTLSLLWFSRLP